MSSNIEHEWMIAYDIRHPKRLGRVHKYMVQHAVPIQYSVFRVRATSEVLAEILHDLAIIIDEEKDDIRCYPLTDPLEYDHHGKQEVAGISLLTK